VSRCFATGFSTPLAEIEVLVAQYVQARDGLSLTECRQVGPPPFRTRCDAVSRSRFLSVLCGRRRTATWVHPSEVLVYRQTRHGSLGLEVLFVVLGCELHLVLGSHPHRGFEIEHASGPPSCGPSQTADEASPGSVNDSLRESALAGYENSASDLSSELEESSLHHESKMTRGFEIEHASGPPSCGPSRTADEASPGSVNDSLRESALAGYENSTSDLSLELDESSLHHESKTRSAEPVLEHQFEEPSSRNDWQVESKFESHEWMEMGELVLAPP
jgi:hypothetical protein